MRINIVKHYLKTYKSLPKKLRVNRKNFHKDTDAIFKYKSKSPFSKNKYDYMSKSGSKYIYKKKGVWRKSDHWGSVGHSYWPLENAPKGKMFKEVVGYARYKKFDFLNRVTGRYDPSSNKLMTKKEYYKKYLKPKILEGLEDKREIRRAVGSRRLDVRERRGLATRLAEKIYKPTKAVKKHQPRPSQSYITYVNDAARKEIDSALKMFAPYGKKKEVDKYLKSTVKKLRKRLVVEGFSQRSSYGKHRK